MTMRIFVPVFALVAGLIFSSAVMAQRQGPQPGVPVLCKERGEILDKLSSTYSETPIAAGLSATGSVFEVIASEGGSWTMLMTRASGISCVLAWGQGWQALDPEVVDQTM